MFINILYLCCFLINVMYVDIVYMFFVYSKLCDIIFYKLCGLIFGRKCFWVIMVFFLSLLVVFGRFIVFLLLL